MQQLSVMLLDDISGRLREDFVRGLADDALTGNTEVVDGRLVDQDIAPGVDVLDHDGDRNVLDDLVEEHPVAVALLLEPHPLGNVFDDADQIARLAVGVADRMTPGGDKAAARRRDTVMPVLDDAVAGRQRLFIQSVDDFGVRRREQLAHGLADRLLPRKSPEFLGDAIGMHEAPLDRVLDHDHHRHVIQHVVEKLALPLPVGLKGLQFGDVLDGREPSAAGQRLVGDAQRHAVAGFHDMRHRAPAPGVVENLREDLMRVVLEPAGRLAKME